MKLDFAMPNAHPDGSRDAPLARYRALAAVSKTIVAHRDLETLSQDLAGQVRPVVVFDNLALALHEKDSNAIRVRVLEGYTILDRSDLVFSLDGTPEAELCKKLQPTVLSDAAELQSLPSLAKVLEPVGINSVCLLPLITTRGLLGVLAFASYRPSAYDSEDMDFLKAVAYQVAVAVENALAFRDNEELNKRLSEQTATARSLGTKPDPKTKPLTKAVPNAAAMLPEAIRIVIENTSRSVDDRLREVSRTLPDFYSFQSPQLGEMFGCTADNIRQTRWWRVDKAEWLATQRRDGPSYDDL